MFLIHLRELVLVVSYSLSIDRNSEIKKGILGVKFMGLDPHCDKCYWAAQWTTQMCPPGEEPFDEEYTCPECKNKHWVLGCRPKECKFCNSIDKIKKQAYKNVPKHITIVNYTCKECRRSYNLDKTKIKIDPDNNYYGQTIDLSKIENLQMAKSDDPGREENLERYRKATEIVCKIHDKLYKEGKFK